MVTIQNRDGEIVQRSRNLRGIIERSGKQTVILVSVAPLEKGRAALTVGWADGSWTRTEFESLTVAQQWVKARRAFPV